MMYYISIISKYAVIILSAAILARCLRSMLHERSEPEIWAYIHAGRSSVPVYHWENIIGRGRNADIRLFGDGIGRTHAVLKRSDRGVWTVYDVFSKSGVWVNGERVPGYGEPLANGDIINLGGSCVRFSDITTEQRIKLESDRTAAGVKVNPFLTLLYLTLFQAFLLLQYSMSSSGKYLREAVLAYSMIMLLEWALYNGMRIFRRKGFEVEILAFYLTTLGISVAASSTPEDLYKQMLLILVSVLMFLFGGWWLRNNRRTSAMRIPVALLALALLGINVLSGSTVYGASNWLTFGGYSFQPSEFVKAAYIYVGAASLDRLYRRNNLFVFIVFSAICVGALAIIGDFGTALIFFISFLVISFMRSGSIATVFLAAAGAVMAGILIISVKPYIADRFSIWGHVWEDVYDRGYQQTRALSAAASGGLIGKGSGAGWLKNIFAANTDMVFAMVCEELGMIVAVCMVLAVLLMAFFAVRSTRNGRSAYSSIAACTATAMLLVQLALNAFGSLDILPFTGVTFPFVSRGGSSLISCWMLMSYLKAADNRRNASFAVPAVRKIQGVKECIETEAEDYSDYPGENDSLNGLRTDRGSGEDEK